MRVLYLHQHFSTPEGAAGTRSFAMARALVARGHDVTLACGSYAGAQTGVAGPFRNGVRSGSIEGIRIVEFAISCGNAQRLGRRALAFARYAAATTRLALAEAPDVVVASSTPLSVVLPALAARRVRGTPFVFEIRDPWPELPRAMGVGGPRLWWAMDRLADAACREASAVVALSEGMAATALSHGAAPGRVAVVPNGCDLDLFGPQNRLWRPAGVAPRDVLAVYAGAHGIANGLDQLLDAAARLAAHDARLRLVLVGEGSERARLQARAVAERLDNVLFLPPMPKACLAGLLEGAQIGLQCLAPVAAFAELTAPNKLMDYLAAGLPVVANTSGRMARLLADGPAGLVVPAGDVGALAGALHRLAGDPALRGAMAAAARRLAVHRWDRRLLADQFCTVVEQAAAPVPEAPRSADPWAPHARPGGGRRAPVPTRYRAAA